MRIKNLIITLTIVAAFALAFVFSSSPPVSAAEKSKNIQTACPFQGGIDVADIITATNGGDIPIVPIGNFSEYYSANLPNLNSGDKPTQNKLNFNFSNKFIYRIILPRNDKTQNFPEPNLFADSRKLGFNGFGADTFCPCKCLVDSYLLKKRRKK